MSTSVVPASERSPHRSENPDAIYEIVDGVEVEIPKMGFYAAKLGRALFLLLNEFLNEKDLGEAYHEFFFILDGKGLYKRRPDVAFLSAERWALDQPTPEEGDCPAVPDLAAEIVSPNDSVYSLFEKIDEYFRFGVREVWVVIPRGKKIHVYTSPTHVTVLTENDLLISDKVLPGFTLKVADLFARVK